MRRTTWAGAMVVLRGRLAGRYEIDRDFNRSERSEDRPNEMRWGWGIGPGIFLHLNFYFEFYLRLFYFTISISSYTFPYQLYMIGQYLILYYRSFCRLFAGFQDVRSMWRDADQQQDGCNPKVTGLESIIWGGRHNNMLFHTVLYWKLVCSDKISHGVWARNAMHSLWSN